MRRALQLVFSGSLLFGELVLGSVMLRMLEPDKELWSWPNSLYFCFTAVTTVGYGNFTPEASASHYFIVFYLLLGIPTLFCFVGLLSEMFSSWNSQLVSWLLENLSGLDVRLPMARRTVAWLNLLLSGFWLFAVIIVSSIAIVYHGGAPFSLSLYFVVVSYTTVGFGDINPYNMDALVSDASDYDSDSITIPQLSLFIAMTFIGLCCVGTTLAALQGYLQLILDRTYHTASMMFPGAFPGTMATDKSGLDRSQNLWLSLVGHESGVLRLWDLEHGRALLQLDSAARRNSSQEASNRSIKLRHIDSDGGHEGKDSDPEAPGGAHSIQIKMMAGRRSIFIDKDPGPPVMCCILPHHLGCRSNNNIIAISAHTKGSLHAWSVAGCVGHLAHVDVVNQGDMAQGSAKPSLLCATHATVLGQDQVITGDGNGRVSMWSLHHVNSTGGSVEWKFKEIPVADLEVAVRCVSVSQCGQRLVTGGGNEAFFSFKDVGVVLVWNLLVDNQVCQIENIRQGPVVAVATLDSADGFATAHLNNSAILIWDLAMKPGNNTYKPSMILEGHAGPVSCLSFVAGQRLLISGSKDRTLAVWDTALGQPLSVLTGHSGAVTSTAVANGSLAKTENDILTGSFFSSSTSGSSSYLSESLMGDSPVGKGSNKLRMISGSDDGSIKLWERQAPEFPFVHCHTFYVPGDDTSSVCCSAVAFVPALTESQRRSSRTIPSSLMRSFRRSDEQSKSKFLSKSSPTKTRSSSYDSLVVAPRSLSASASCSGSGQLSATRRNTLGTSLYRGSSSGSSQDPSRLSAEEACLDGMISSMNATTVDDSTIEPSLSLFSINNAGYRNPSTVREALSKVQLTPPEIGQSDSYYDDDSAAVDLSTTSSSAATVSIRDNPGFPSTLAAIQSGRVLRLIEPWSFRQEQDDSASESDGPLFQWIKEDATCSRLGKSSNIKHYEYAVPSSPQSDPSLARPDIEDQRATTDRQDSHNDRNEFSKK